MSTFTSISARGHAIALRLALPLTAFAITGCQQAQLAEQRLKMQSRSLEWTFKTAEKSEQKRPLRLESTTQLIGTNLERHAEMSARWGPWIGAWFERDAEKWEDSDRRYADPAARIFWGNPEIIEETAILAFY